MHPIKLYSPFQSFGTCCSKHALTVAAFFCWMQVNKSRPNLRLQWILRLISWWLPICGCQGPKLGFPFRIAIGHLLILCISWAWPVSDLSGLKGQNLPGLLVHRPPEFLGCPNRPCLMAGQSLCAQHCLASDWIQVLGKGDWISFKNLGWMCLYMLTGKTTRIQVSM